MLVSVHRIFLQVTRPFSSVLLKPFCFTALNMTSASSFQMLRGAVIIFTGLLSVAFLGRRLAPNQWIGIFITILGLVIVGLADFISGNKDSSHKLSDVITGKMFCFLWGLFFLFFIFFLTLDMDLICLFCLFDMIGLQSVSVKKTLTVLLCFCFLSDCRRSSDHHGSDHCVSADGPRGKVCLHT